MTTTEHNNERMSRAWQLYEDLLNAILGDAMKAKVDPDFLGCLYELTDDELHVLARFLSRYQTLRSSYLTVKDVAEQLRVSPRLIQRLAQSGALRGAQRRGRWEFTPKAVARFVENVTYNAGGRIQPPKEEDEAAHIPDADLLDRARAVLGTMPWTTRFLATELETSYDRAYRLLLAWHAAGVVDRVVGARGQYIFTAQP